MYFKILIFNLFFILISFSLHSQGEANNWFFGKFAGISFNTFDSKPIALTNGQLQSYEGCSSISDRNGNLLLYTSGDYTWNRNHEKINKLENYFVNNTVTQMLLAPKPNDRNIFYLFIPSVENFVTMSHFTYYEIDLRLNNNTGNFTEKYHKFLYDKSTEKVAGVKHKNKKDIWILSHKWESNEFYSYLLSEDGIIEQPIINSVGEIHIGGITPVSNILGYMKFSPDGSKVALAIDGGIIEIFDFDNFSGVLSNPITYKLDSTYRMYGIEFSPNSQLLYFTLTGARYSKISSKLFQLNLKAGNSNDILKSVMIIDSVFYKSDRDDFISALQLAPDGKIYASRYDHDTIAVINHPNEIGQKCDFKINGLFLNSFIGPNLVKHGICSMGLPGFISSYFKEGIQVWLPDTTSHAGEENFCIPLNAKLKLDTTITVSIKYKITISFAADLFVPDNNPKITNNYITNGRRYLVLEGNNVFPQYTKVWITDICGTVLAGDSLYTDLKIEDVILSGINAEPDLLDGSLKIDNYCASKLRKIISFKPISFTLSPNPVNEFLEISRNFQSEEIFILNLYGQNVSPSGGCVSSAEGGGQFKIDVSSLPSGMYFVRIGDKVNKFVKF